MTRQEHLQQARAHIRLARALLVFGYPLDTFERQLCYAADNRRLAHVLYPAPKHMLYTMNDRAAFFTALLKNEPCEITEELYLDQLEVLPPKSVRGKGVRMTGMGGVWSREDGTVIRFDFAQAEGHDNLVVYYTTRAPGETKRWWALRTPFMHPGD